MKKVLSVLTALCLFLSVSVNAFAMYDDSEPKSGYPVDPPVGLTLTYNGKEQIGVLTSENSSFINAYGYDVVNYTATDAGTYTATAMLWGDMGPQTFVWSDGTIADKFITFTIKKANNSLSAKGKNVTLRFAELKNKNQTVKRKKAITVKNAKGKVTYKPVKKDKRFKVAKSGNIIVKKGLKKGTYKVKIKVTAAGDKNYKSLTKTVTVKIVVK